MDSGYEGSCERFAAPENDGFERYGSGLHRKEIDQ